MNRLYKQFDVFRRLLDTWKPPKGFTLITTSILVGIVTALGAVGLIWLLKLLHTFTGWCQKMLGPWLGLLLVMGVAGTLVGWMVHRWAQEAKGHGVPEVMEAVAIRGGQIRTRVGFVKLIASVLTIGAGGSAGREGPIVQIGSAFGSALGQLLHLSHKRVRILVACGAAAGVAATFNAPIAGTIFAMEVILASFTTRYFGAVVLSSVSASVLSRMLLGDHASIDVPHYPLAHVGELPIYLVLAVLAAFIAVAFIRLLYAAEDLFEKLPLPAPLISAIGMLLTATCALSFSMPQILGPGLDTISHAITRNFQVGLGVMVGLLLLKLLATSFTLGSGNSGGIFAPSLFMGAILGGIVGSIAHNLWPQIAPNPGAYAIVGMAAVFAGTARAPITAVLIVFELSNDYRLILPLMLCVVVAHSLAELLCFDSIYTWKLAKKGIRLREGRDVNILEGILVDQVMERNFQSVDTHTTTQQLSDVFSRNYEHGIIVLNDEGKLWGLVTVTDLKEAISHGISPDAPVTEFACPYPRVQVAYPDETVGEALERMGVRGFSLLPVVSREDPFHPVGIIQRKEIIDAYNMALTRQAEIQHRTERTRLTIDGTEFVDVILQANDAIVGKTLNEIGPNLPKDCIFISIRRGQTVLIPHGNTTFRKGDLLTAFVRSEDIERLFSCIRTGKISEQPTSTT